MVLQFVMHAGMGKLMRNAQNVSLSLESDAFDYATRGVLFRPARFLLHLNLFITKSSIGLKLGIWLLTYLSVQAR
jgi:hypothetical protein